MNDNRAQPVTATSFKSFADAALQALQELHAGPGGHRSGTVVELAVSEGGTPPQPQFRVSLAATDPAPDA